MYVSKFTLLILIFPGDILFCSFLTSFVCCFLFRPKARSASSIILRGANDFMLDEMERSMHDAICVVKRVLESKTVAPGGGAVEAALSIYLENFATSLVSGNFSPPPPPPYVLFAVRTINLLITALRQLQNEAASCVKID